jgi:DNA-binding MarR family transcriptional regulator
MSCDKNESMGRQIYMAAQDIKNFAEKILLPYGLTLEQFHLLKNIAGKDGMSQRTLGLLVSKSPANITRILDRLEAKSLVSRRNSPDDRRATQVFLTKKGLAVLQQALGVLESFSAQLTSGIDLVEQEATRATLHKIARNLQIMANDLKTE